MQEVKIGPNDAGQRLDRWLSKQFPNLPFGTMQKAVRAKKIKVNRKRAQPNQMLEEGDAVLLFLAPALLTRKEEAPAPLPDPDIVYEDENLLVVNKPAGLLSQKDKPMDQDTLNDRVLYYLYRTGQWTPGQDSFVPGIAHRLDRNTKGLVLAAKNAQASRKLASYIAQGQVKKVYHGLMEGWLPEQDVRAWMKKEETKALVRNSGQEGWQEARMHIRPLKREGDLTWMECTLDTGRFHQIRALLSDLGHPLAKDRKYGSKKEGQYELEAVRLELPDLKNPERHLVFTTLEKESD